MNRAERDRCLVCEGETSYYFSKQYEPYEGSPFEQPLAVDYWRCGHCGFVASRTHQRMSEAQWSALNASWHHFYENHLEARVTNQPPYADQALALAMLSGHGLVDLGDAIDYAAGYGTLSRFMGKYFGRTIPVFDRYVTSADPGLRYLAQDELATYRLVVNSAMFEHVLTRRSLDEVNELVAEDGVLMLHTVVCERVPPDPDWFYLRPIVHTAFHTNKSMAILMAQWGYAASVYAPQAKSWYLFKRGCAQLADLERRIGDINREIQTRYFHYKPGFVDYWKGF